MCRHASIRIMATMHFNKEQTKHGRCFLELIKWKSSDQRRTNVETWERGCAFVHESACANEPLDFNYQMYARAEMANASNVSPHIWNENPTQFSRRRSRKRKSRSAIDSTLGRVFNRRAIISNSATLPRTSLAQFDGDSFELRVWWRGLYLNERSRITRRQRLKWKALLRSSARLHVASTRSAMKRYVL